MNVIIICLGGEPLLFPHFEVILNLCQFPLPAPAQAQNMWKILILVVVIMPATQLSHCNVSLVIIHTIIIFSLPSFSINYPPGQFPVSPGSWAIHAPGEEVDWVADLVNSLLARIKDLTVFVNLFRLAEAISALRPSHLFFDVVEKSIGFWLHPIMWCCELSGQRAVTLNTNKNDWG